MARARKLRHWWLDRCFLYVGRMEESKGIKGVLDAWRHLAGGLGESCPPLWLVGGTPGEIDEIRNRCNAQDLRPFEDIGQIRWWGYLDDAGIATLLLKAYVLVCHSRYEPGGRVVIEALSTGTPVIATPHGFARDLVRDWHTGFLVEFGDIDALAARMEHFALQPLLRHAMTVPCQRAAHTALDSWRFSESHLDAYANPGRTEHATVIRDDCSDGVGATTLWRPQAIAGVYPFEAQSPDPGRASAFARESLRTSVSTLRECLPSPRSQLWSFEAAGKVWIIKSPFSTYVRRSIWDKGYSGSGIVSQRQRIAGETFGSTCRSAARLAGVSDSDALLLRELLPPLLPDASSDGACVEAIQNFHSSQVGLDNLQSLAPSLNLDWISIAEEDVYARVEALNRAFSASGVSWDAWRPMSARLGWRLIEIGLRQKTLTLSEPYLSEVLAAVESESIVAATDEPAAALGWSHGDCNPSHFRVGTDKRVVLVDCERVHPGYFGADWAAFVAERVHGGLPLEQLDSLVDGIHERFASRRLLWSWLRLDVAWHLCRTSGLLDVSETEQTWKVWQGIRDRPRRASAGDHDL